MARDFTEIKARMVEKKQERATAQAPAPQPSAPPTPKAEAAAPVAKPEPKPAAPPAPTVTRPAQAVTPKVEEIKPPEPPAAPEPPKFSMPPDARIKVDYQAFYDRAYGTRSSSVNTTAKLFNIAPERLEELARVQGVDLDAIIEARKNGRTYAEIAKAGRERGVIGFMPVEEREAVFSKTLTDVEKAIRGEAPEMEGLKRAGADKGFGPAGALAGYFVPGTHTELPEVSKPGEYGHAVASLLVDAIRKDKEASKIFDLYARSIETGATQGYIRDRVEQLSKQAGIRPSDPESVQKVAALRKRAINEIIAFKTVGQWTPAVTLGDIEVAEGREAPGLIDALKPNVEIIGFNNKRQAIFRQESPMGVLFRVIDIPQEATVGALTGRGAAAGIQTGANFMEYSFENSKGGETYLRAPAIAAGAVAAVFFPDLLMGGGVAAKGVSAAVRKARVKRVAPKVAELLSTIAEARKNKDYTKAIEAEIELRKYTPDIASAHDRYDASVAAKQQIIDPMTDTVNEDLASLIASRIPAAAEEAASRSWLHPSVRKDVLSVKTPTKDIPFTAYDELYNTDRLLKRVGKAKADYLASVQGKTLADYATDYVRGAARSIVTNLADDVLEAAKITPQQIDEIADVVARSGPLTLRSMDDFKKAVRAALKDDPTFSGEAYKPIRQALYRRIGQVERKVADLKKVQSVDELVAPDIALFDRAIKAIEQNNEARGAAAEMLRDEIAGQAKIRVVPSNLFSDVAPKLPNGEPMTLSAGGLVALSQLRKAAPEIPLQEAYAAIRAKDAVIEQAAKRAGIDVLKYYEQKFAGFRRGDRDQFVNQLLTGRLPDGEPPVTPVAPAAPPAAPTAAPRFSVSKHGSMASFWRPRIPADMPRFDVESAADAKQIIEDLRRGGAAAESVTATFARADGTIGASVIAFGDVRILADSPNVGDAWKVIVKVGTENVEVQTSAKKLSAALRAGAVRAGEMIDARVARGEPAVKGVPAFLLPDDIAPDDLTLLRMEDVTEEMTEPTVFAPRRAAVVEEPTEPRIVPTLPEVEPTEPAVGRTLESLSDEELETGIRVMQEEGEPEFMVSVLQEEQARRAALRTRPELAPLAEGVSPVTTKARFVSMMDALRGAADSNAPVSEIRRLATEVMDNIPAGATDARTAAAEAEAVRAATRTEAPAPTIAAPPTPAPIAAAAEVQPEAAKIVEAPVKRKRASRRGAAPGGKTWIDFFRQTVKPENPSDALRAVAQRIIDLYEDPDFAQSLATAEATARFTGKTPEQILEAPPRQRKAYLKRLEVDGGVSEYELDTYISARDWLDLTPEEALELARFTPGTKASDLTPEILNNLAERLVEIAGEVGGPEKLEDVLRERGAASVESLADVRYNAKDLQDRIVPMNVDQAFDFVRKVHSKLPDPRPQGLLEAYGVAAGGDVRVVGLLNTPPSPFADQSGIVELSRVASDGKLKNGSSAITYWAMQNFQRYNRSGDPAKGRLVTTSLLTEPGEVYKALEPEGLHPTSLVTPSEGTGSRAGAKGTAQKGEWKINWEFGPAAAPEAPHLYHIQPVYRDVVMNGEKLSIKRLNSLIQRPGTDLVDAYKDAARVLGVSSEEPAMKAAETVSTASPAGRRLLAEDLRHMLLEKFNSKAVADADRKEQAKLLNKALKPEAPAAVVAEPLTSAAVDAATTSTPQVEAALISTETTPSRIQMAAKQTNVRNPELVAMANAVREGKATREQYEALVNRLRPITPYKQLPTPTPEAQMQTALKSNQKSKIGAPRQVAEGTPVGLRVDIPALQDHGAWVVTVHEKRKSKSPRSLAGSVVGYDNVAAVKNAEFVVPSENSVLIAAGVDNKMPYATIEGAWVPQTTEEAVARAQAAFNDPAWVQVGQDPLRHAYFYDRATTQPIVAAEEVIQIGPLVLAKNPTYAPKEKFLYQVSPTGEIKGATEWLKDGRALITLFEGADASTVLHEVAHVVRRSVLNADDMEAITAWVKSRGAKVGHEFGEFTGDADEVEKAEELFAKAFEQYVAEGAVPTPALTSVFDILRNAVGAVYRGVSDPVIGTRLQPQVRTVFDNLLASTTEQAAPTLKQAIRREILGGAEDEEDFFDILSREAKRRGIGGATYDELAARFDAAAASAEARGRNLQDTDVVFQFPVPVLGKRDWTVGDLADMQASREMATKIRTARRAGIRMDLAATGRGTAALVREETPVEAIRAAVAARDTDTQMTAAVRKAFRTVVGAFFGGDAVAEQSGDARNLLRWAPPEFRKALNAPERVVEQSLSDVTGLLNDAVDLSDSSRLLAYLSGATKVQRLNGRQILSSGHDYMASVLRMWSRRFAQLTPDERKAMEYLADAVNAPDASTRLARLGFNMDGTTFSVADAAAEKIREGVVRAAGKMLYSSKSGKDVDFGEALSQALRSAVEAPDNMRPTHEMRLLETITYVSGQTAREGRLFDGDSKKAAELLIFGEPGKKNGIRNIYDEESARRSAVLVAGFGSSDLAKDVLVKLDLGVDAATQRGFANWLAGEQPGWENVQKIQDMVDRYGFNPEFVRDPILGADVYIPRLARERIAAALSKSTFVSKEAVGVGDMLRTAYTTWKLRVTRGNVVVRQRYFMMNTVDDFNAVAMVEGFGVAAAASARTVAQDLMVLPFWQQLTLAARNLPGGQRIPADILERARAGLQKLGDRGAQRIGSMVGVSKYRIEVNPILEGLDGGFRAGGKIYNYRDVRRVAVEEGIFSSYETTELQNAILREGELIVRQTRTGPTLVTGSVRGRGGRLLAGWQNSVKDIAEAWGERTRLGTMITLMEAGHDPRTAARITIDALFDYNKSMTKADRGLLVNILFPFWAFQKNANAQIFNLLFSPSGAYRMMCIKRARERSADLMTALLYNDVTDEYGVDVESMPPELQDSYYSIITAFEQSFGPDGPTPEAKQAMRLLLAGRAMDVVGGKFVTTSPTIIQLQESGAFAEIEKFQAFAVAEPSKTGRSTMYREREGVAITLPRTEAVRTAMALLGDDHAYMEMFWPDSVIEAGMKYHTQVAATMLLMGAYGTDFVGLTDLKEEGLEGISPLRAIKPLTDPARSPIVATIVGGELTSAAPRKRVATALTPAGVAKVHPFVGKMLDDYYGAGFLRVPKEADPFLVNDQGQIEQLPVEMQERIRALQQEYPDIGVIKDQRYYMLGRWSVALDASPLGELNDMLLRYEEEPLQRADIRGEILRWARAAAGVDVTLTTPSRTAAYEETRKVTETKNF